MLQLLSLGPGGSKRGFAKRRPGSRQRTLDLGSSGRGDAEPAGLVQARRGGQQPNRPSGATLGHREVGELLEADRGARPVVELAEENQALAEQLGGPFVRLPLLAQLSEAAQCAG